MAVALPSADRVAVVLGAGGAVGWIFHLGVVAALDRLGAPPGRVGRLIGTSAGAGIAASARAGARPDDTLASLTAPMTAPDRAHARGAASAGERFPPARLCPLSPGLISHALGGPGGLGVAVAGLVPAGRYGAVPPGRFAGIAALADWPTGLWVPAVRAGDGERVVFGRDEVDATVVDAVEASSAVPGLMRPKRIGTERYVDGGAWSPTNADLAIGSGAEVVVISSALTRPGHRPLRLLARRRLDEERARLERAGIVAVTVEPDAAAGALAAAAPHRDRQRAARVVAAAGSLTEEALAATVP